jgi:hypothetical protein
VSDIPRTISLTFLVLGNPRIDVERQGEGQAVSLRIIDWYDHPLGILASASPPEPDLVLGMYLHVAEEPVDVLRRSSAV